MRRKLILYSYFMGCLLILAGCHEQGDKASSQAFRSVYSRFDHFLYTQAVRNSLDSVVKLHPDLPFTDQYDYYTFMCGYYHVAEHNDVKALSYTDSLLLLVTTHKNEPDNTFNRRAAAYLARGGVLFSLKKYNSALNYLYQSKVAAEQSNNTDIRSDVYYTIGMVMYRKLNFSQAAAFFKQSFEATNTKQPMEFGKFYRMQEVLNNIAESYMMAYLPDSALVYSAKARAFIDANQSFYKDKKLMEVAQAVVKGTAGQAYLLKGDTATGEAYLRESIAINSRPTYDNGSALQMQLAMAQFYLDHGFENKEPTETADVLMAIGKGLDTIHNEEQEARWNYLMSRYYDTTHNPAMALLYLKQGISYDKKTEGENKVLSETNINSYFQALQNEYEMQLLRKNGEMERIYLIISVILSILGSIIILLIWRHWIHSKKNVALLKRLNKKVKRQKAKLEQTLIALNEKSAEKDHILKVIAHDLRNPISAIYALSKLLKDDPTLDEEQIECLNLVSSASVESLELIDAIMQMEDGQRKISDTEKVLCDINGIVSDCVGQLKLQANSKSQKIVMHLPNEPQMAMVDAGKIQRVVKNLLSNAIKFSHKGEEIVVSLTGKDESIIIKIQDKGIGIPEKLQDKVFNPFTDARRKGTEEEKTFGLGLSICKQFVEAHDGKIWFKSKENQGTSFYVKLHKAENNTVIDYDKDLASVNESV